MKLLRSLLVTVTLLQVTLHLVISPDFLTTSSTPEGAQPSVHHHVKLCGELGDTVFPGALHLLEGLSVHVVHVHLQVPGAIELLLAHSALSSSLHLKNYIHNIFNHIVDD